MASVALFAAGCSDAAPTRTEVVTDLSTDVMVPVYEQLAEVGDGLLVATEGLCDDGDDSSAARAALADARVAWSTSESIWLGPVMDRRSWALVDWPTSAERIYALLADEWTVAFDDGPPNGKQVTDDAEATLDALVNDSLFLLEAMADLELGAALGITRAEADVTAIYEGPDGLGVADLVAHLDGIEEVFDGLAPLLSDDLGERLGAAIDAASHDTALVDAPLVDAVVETPGVVEQARDSIKAVQVLIGTEVVSELGVTIGFSDADGDTGA